MIEALACNTVYDKSHFDQVNSLSPISDCESLKRRLPLAYLK
jgi:hypothetical protein